MNPFLDEIQIEENTINQLLEDLDCAIHWESIYETNEEDWQGVESSASLMCLAWSMCQM